MCEAISPVVVDEFYQALAIDKWLAVDSLVAAVSPGIFAQASHLARQRWTMSAIAFGRQGYLAAQVFNIVAEAGVARGTFYLYFDGKKAIVLEPVGGFLTNLLKVMLRQHSAADLARVDDVTREIRATGRAILTYCRAEPALTALVLNKSDALGPNYRDHIADHYQAVVVAISSHLPAAPLRPTLRLGSSSGWSSVQFTIRSLLRRTPASTRS